jgi:hypothetical protein
MRCLKNLDAWSGGGWGVFIAPTSKPTVGRLSIDGCTGQFGVPLDTVRCACHVTQSLGFWRFRPLERWLHVAPDSPVPHRIATVQCPVRSDSLRTVAHYSVWQWSLKSTVALGAVAPLGAPDSSVAHRIVRWIIAERRLRNPKVKSSVCTAPGALDTVRWCTGHCPVRQTRVLFGFFCSFLLNPNFDLFIGLCWTFSTCRIYNLEQTS